jgi:hypothetical protein
MVFFFKRDKTKESSIFTQHSWIMDLFAPFVIGIMGVQFTCATKIHVLLSYYKRSCSNYRQLQPSDYTPTPLPQPMPSKTHLRLPMSTAYLATYLNTLNWNQGRSIALAPNALESGRGLGKTYFTLYGNSFY